MTVTSDEDLELALKEMEGPVFRFETSRKYYVFAKVFSILKLIFRFTASELDPKSDTKSKDAKVIKNMTS